MNGRTNAKNGAGAIRDGCAILEVKAPAYSQITAVRADGLTKKQNKGYIDLSNSDYWFYYIIIQKFELSNLIWTVTGTNEMGTVSDTVVITSNKEYEIVLPFPLRLYYYGDTMDAITGGYQAKSKQASDSSYGPGTPNITYNSDNMYISFPTNSSGYVCTNNSIDVTDFNTLCALVNLTGSAPTNGQYYFGLLSTITTTYWYSYLTPSLSLGPKTPGTEVEISVDITAITGSRYITFAQNANINGRITVYKIWLEP